MGGLGLILPTWMSACTALGHDWLMCNGIAVPHLWCLRCWTVLMVAP